MAAYHDGYWSPNVEGKVMVIYSMNDLEPVGLKQQGMFQEFFHVLGAIKWGQRRGAAAIRIHFDSAYYSNKTGENYWNYFFEPYITLRTDIARPTEEVHFNGCCGRFGMLGSFTNEAIGTRGETGSVPFPLLLPPCMENCGIVKLGGLVHDYIRPKPLILDVVNAFAEKHFANKYVITVQYRGTDKQHEWPLGMGKYSTFETLIRRVVANIPTQEERDNYVIFVASDEAGAVRYLHKAFGDRCVSVDNVPRLEADDKSAYFGAHKSAKYSPWEKSVAALVDALLLSKGRYLVRNRSTVSSVSLLFNTPNVNHSYIVSDIEILHFSGDANVASGFDYPPVDEATAEIIKQKVAENDK